MVSIASQIANHLVRFATNIGISALMGAFVGGVANVGLNRVPKLTHSLLSHTNIICSHGVYSKAQRLAIYMRLRNISAVGGSSVTAFFEQKKTRILTT